VGHSCLRTAAAAAISSQWKQLTIQELLEMDAHDGVRAAPIRFATQRHTIQVLTRDDLHRAGVRYLAEAFRLVTACTSDALTVGPGSSTAEVWRLMAPTRCR
jgi:hypothetical protein